MQRMKTAKLTIVNSILRAVIALLVCSFAPMAMQAAGKPKPTTNPSVELRVLGPIYSLPDYTARNGFDQCRGTRLDSENLMQRKTTIDLTALGNPCFVGPFRHVFGLQFGGQSAAVGAPVIVSFWVTRNCQLTAAGRLVSGQWPLTTASPALAVEVAAGETWTFTRYGGPQCAGTATLEQAVRVECYRNDARTGAPCDCPFDFTDADENMVADDCE